MSSSAVYSVSLFRGANSICLGSLHMYLRDNSQLITRTSWSDIEPYLNGPSIVSKSCVPMATKRLCLQRF
jgi:hypothetical protein